MSGDGTPLRTAYGVGFVDGLHWMLHNGAEHAQRLHDLVVAPGHSDVIPDLAERATLLVCSECPDFVDFLKTGGPPGLKSKMADLQPDYPPGPAPHLGRYWVRPPSPN